MSEDRIGAHGLFRGRMMAGALLVVLSLLAVVWFSPDLPYWPQDAAWPLALNEATARHLAFGRAVIFNLGPWSSVYTGQYHPFTDPLMIGGGVLVALALGLGLATVARGKRIYASLLAPLTVASVGLHDPVFMALPVLLLAVSVALAQPSHKEGSAPVVSVAIAALVLLTAADALLSLVKLTFGTEALPMAVLSALALAARRRFAVSALLIAVYACAAPLFWAIAGQRFGDLWSYVGSVPLILGGYTEGAAKNGAWTDILAYLLAAGCFVALLWRDRSRVGVDGQVFLGTGLLATLFLAFKSGFVRHDEHSLIAFGALGLLPLVTANALRTSSLVSALAAAAIALAFASHHDPGEVWPSPERTFERLAGAARGAWFRALDPGQLPHLYASDLASHRKAFPLLHVDGPTDIYSAGQTILIANGLDWSPRPALQSFTAFSLGVAKADLDHLEGDGGRSPPVQNVFFSVEDEDHRLPTTEDGLSWPALFDEFRVSGYDRRIDMARFRRSRPPGPISDGPVVLDARFALEADVPIPISPTGLFWADLDLRPTLAGRLVSFLFRPPALSIAITYAEGPPERYRLLSALGRAGFLLGPRVADTAEMLLLRLPARRAPFYRPTSISITGGFGSGWLWRRHFGLVLRAIDLPSQPDIRPLVVITPDAPSASTHRMLTDDHCEFDIVDDRYGPRGRVPVRGLVRIAGWLVPAADAYGGPDRVLLRLTEQSGTAFEAPAPPRWRPDVSAAYGAAASPDSGFDEILDLSALHGDVRLTVETVKGDKQRVCRASELLSVLPIDPVMAWTGEETSGR